MGVRPVESSVLSMVTGVMAPVVVVVVVVVVVMSRYAASRSLCI